MLPREETGIDHDVARTPNFSNGGSGEESHSNPNDFLTITQLRLRERETETDMSGIESSLFSYT